MAAQRTKGVDSARRALQILLQFSDDKPELKVEELVQIYDISLASVYRYISLLRELYLVEERSKGVFILSPQILQLARAAEKTMDYRNEAQPFLDRLSANTGETALYLQRVNDAAVCVAISETDHAISISFQPGNVMALHAGAGAKILLSDFSPARRDQYLDRCTPQLSAKARDKILKDLEQIRTDDFAQSEGEVDSGVWACAAPVRFKNVLIGAISIVAPAYRTDGDKQKTIACQVRNAGVEMGSTLEK